MNYDEHSTTSRWGLVIILLVVVVIGLLLVANLPQPAPQAQGQTTAIVVRSTAVTARSTATTVTSSATCSKEAVKQYYAALNPIDAEYARILGKQINSGNKDATITADYMKLKTALAAIQTPPCAAKLTAAYKSVFDINTRAALASLNGDSSSAAALLRQSTAVAESMLALIREINSQVQ